MLWDDIPFVFHYDVTTLLLKHFLWSSEILKPFKAKPQSKNIQRLKLTIREKLNIKSKTNKIPNF